MNTLWSVQVSRAVLCQCYACQARTLWTWRGECSADMASSGGQPWQAKSHRIYYGHIVDQAGTVVDEVTPRICRAQQCLAASSTTLESFLAFGE